MKNEIIQRINAVMQTLDKGIEVRGVRSAGNLAGCYQVLGEVITMLKNCDILPVEKKDDEMKLK